MSRTAPQHIAGALRTLAATLAPATALARIQERWQDATGPVIASAARPVAERDGVLTIVCEAAVWAQELHLMSPQLIARLNGELGGEVVRELRCRTG